MTAIIASMAVLLHHINSWLCAAGRSIGIVAIAAMVVAILIQVFFRYALNNALPWPDEAARFCMLWMTGLMAPTAFRRGGFVAIDTLNLMLPRSVASVLNLLLLAVSLLVLVIAIQIGWKEVNGIGGRFTSASLYLPTSLSFDQWFRLPRSWMMLSLVVGLVLLILVNVELLARQIVQLLSKSTVLPEIPDGEVGGAE